MYKQIDSLVMHFLYYAGERHQLKSSLFFFLGAMHYVAVFCICWRSPNSRKLGALLFRFKLEFMFRQQRAGKHRLHSCMYRKVILLQKHNINTDELIYNLQKKKSWKGKSKKSGAQDFVGVGLPRRILEIVLLLTIILNMYQHFNF